MNYLELGDLIKIKKGKKLEEVQSISGSAIRYIQIEDLRTDENLKYASKDGNVIECNSNDILIAWDGANAGTVGFGLEGAIGSTLAKLVLIKKFYTPFVGRLLQSKFEFIRNTCTGATIPHVSKSALLSIQIPDICFQEQKRIADLLDKADALRKKNKELLAAYDELLKATFLDMFGDPVSNPKGWKEKCFKDVVSGIVGGFSVGGEQRELHEDELGVLKVSAVTSGVFLPTEYKAISTNKIDRRIINPKRGDLLFSRANTRDLVGAVAIVDKDYDRLFLPDKLWRIDLKRNVVSNHYIHRLLSTDNFRPELTKTATGTSGSMLNISQAKLNRLKIPLPPFGLQSQFAQIVENIEAQKVLVKQSLQESEDLFNGLVQKAFKD
ncbi:MAG: restriction endonuclease subunit S [Bacteroidales bacterium]|nr:restriction endonuclease subunit S [Bacteroidales bacterium]